MSSAPQHGRRRAEPARKPSRREALAADASVSITRGPARRMAVVAVAAALLAGGGLAQAATNSAQGGVSAASLVSGAEATASPSAISAPSDIAVSFSRIDVSSAAKAKAKAPAVKSEADAVTPVASPAKAAAPVLVDDPAAAQAYAAGQLATKGWGADQMSCLSQLWTRESSWLTSAENASSGAYGVAQSLPAEKMASAGADYRTNYKTQIRWGLSYIDGRYGTPCGAWAHSEAVGWY
ncbi:hypothetical protein CVV68_01685 [Arthrobacter livingstonensis]|uniref:Lytic transglycosylase domain-containing protein n=1 Tax=Arthrobacter livingstonensis TaxID=670078 RepID=A0A2V5LDM4_9MICC|nr:hypothetical protein [Arthrobacter livingstonensis]PYI69841.1 hypothetical protein CVV68_01685 [Arthrobacter livingstonensis]